MENITPEQQEIINSLQCVRLTSDEAHRDLIKSFNNIRNNGLADSLRAEAWEDDANGSVAYYLIKDKDNNALFFFSLKCGALFNQLNEEQIRQDAKIGKALEQIIKTADKDDPTAMLIMEKIRSGKQITDEELRQYIRGYSSSKRRLLKHLIEDQQAEANDNIIRVRSTHSGVEIVHFCKNDNTKDIWKKTGLPKSLGNIVFWRFVIPILEQIQSFVGCKYAFLFAADLSDDGSLINYYQTDLHFEIPDDIGTNKPMYDLKCKFMCQTVNQLLADREYFFSHFNPDTEDYI